MFLYLALVVPGRSFAQSATPSQLKAAYIYNFVKFVEWPATGSIRSKSIAFCVDGKDAVSAALEQGVTGKMVQGRNIEVRTVTTTEQAQTCQVLYIGQETNSRAPALLAGLQKTPVLTVGEGPDFISSGGVIGFIVESNHLRFMINEQAAEQAGLKISSRLLSLATKVKQ